MALCGALFAPSDASGAKLRRCQHVRWLGLAVFAGLLIMARPAAAGEGGVSFRKGIGVGVGIGIGGVIISDAIRRGQQRAPRRARSQVRAGSGGGDVEASESEIETVQRALQHLGFDPGSIDGEIGSRTRSAIRAYQESVGLPVTGTLTAPVKERLLQTSPAAPQSKAVDGHTPSDAKDGASVDSSSDARPGQR